MIRNEGKIEILEVKDFAESEDWELYIKEHGVSDVAYAAFIWVEAIPQTLVKSRLSGGNYIFMGHYCTDYGDSGHVVRVKGPTREDVQLKIDLVKEEFNKHKDPQGDRWS